MRVSVCSCECGCCVRVSFKICIYGLWWPSMRGGVVVGAHGDGGWVRKIPDIGGVRWDLVVFRCIGEREILGVDCGWSEFCQNSSP